MVAVAKSPLKAKEATALPLLAFDTETTGLDIIHGCRPFYVSTCDQRGTIECWQWDVDPMTREPIIPDNEKLEIKLLMTGPVLIGHNVGFDIRALESIGIGSFPWSKIRDTLLMSHAINSAEPHGLKALARKYLWINEEDEKDLQRAVTRARAIGKKLGFRIAEEGDPHFPAMKFGDGKEPWKTDMWLPRAVAKHQKYPKGHPWYSVLGKYAQWDAVRTMRLFLAFKAYEAHAKETDEELYQSIIQYRTLNLPVLECTYEMESEGVPVSRTAIKRMIKLADDTAVEQIKRMKRMFPGVNFNSSQQLGEVLFKKLGLPILKRTEKKAASTDKKTLVKLALACKLRTKHKSLLSEKEIQAASEVKMPGAFKGLVNSTKIDYDKADEFLTYLLTEKKVLKLRDAQIGYSDHLEQHGKQWRLHGSYRVTGTRLTRMSGENPNQQNVAKDDDGDLVEHINRFIMSLGLNPRSIFVPPPDELWFTADGNQLQLRIFAAVSGDRNLITAFENDEKLHNYVARKIFRLPDSAPVTDAQKRVAKGCNFGSIFGATDRKIDATAGIDGISDLYADLFPDAKGFMKETMARSIRDGYITTPGGYRLMVDAAHAGVNYIVSGCEGEIMKRAMVDCHQYLKSLRQPGARDIAGHKTACTGRILMQVHDELAFAFKPTIDPVKNRAAATEECLPHLSMLKKLMEAAGDRLGIRTPMEFKAITHSWADGVPIHIPAVETPAVIAARKTITKKLTKSLPFKSTPIKRF